MLTPGLLVLILTCAAVGIALSVIDVGIVAFARERGSAGAAGPLLALFATGSMLAGLAYGAREWRAPPDFRFLVAMAALCAGTLPILFADGILAMALSVAVAGVGIAPALIASSTLVEELVPRASLVEGLTWVVPRSRSGPRRARPWRGARSTSPAAARRSRSRPPPVWSASSSPGSAESPCAGGGRKPRSAPPYGGGRIGLWSVLEEGADAPATALAAVGVRGDGRSF